MKKAIVFFLASALVLTTGNSMIKISNSNTVSRQNTSKISYHAVTIPDDVMQDLKAKGINIKDHVPTSLKNGPHAVNSGAVLGTAPIANEQKAIALYLKFPDNDQPPTSVKYDHMPVAQLQNLLFGDIYDPYSMEEFSIYKTYNGITAPTDRTLKNYYKGISDGRVNVTGQVVEVTMPHGYSYYKIGQNYGLIGENTNGDYTMSLIFEDAIKAADELVDFSQYAKNGVVPNVFLIHQGTGSEFSTDPTVIWSHSWDYESAYYYNRYALTGREDEEGLPKGLEVDNVIVNDYSIEPEVGGDMTGYLGTPSGPYPAYVGVYAHEFGHVLGLPDQYDYGYDSEGTGAYTLMASGSWTRFPNAKQYAGNSPVYLDAWSQVFLGLTHPITLTSGSGSFTLNSVANGGGVVKLVAPDSNGSEYFLVENRQQIGFDSSLSRYGTGIHGLAIYHIDENVLLRNFNRPNEAANWFQSRKQGVNADAGTGETHYGISILQADNKWDLEKNVNVADNGDLYKTGQSFTPTSVPNSGSYYFNNGNGASANYTGIYVNNIVENKNGSVTFNAGFKVK
ncbi:M6 family metalloprotease domain-containing protein [Candidatus Clostridium radicumherbarum]|uniref:M6 family metalloprotease domain-containing protein n=1 Tax=Candidatus Clostridium radicumherbarum TaxID=3381662 RepID=A0ABW8TW93_9CLOT